MKSIFPPKNIFKMSSTNTNIIINPDVLCIPGVFANIGEARIRRAFADLDIGEVTRVDIVIPKSTANASDAPAQNKKFNRVFVHIKWNSSKQASSAREKLLQGKEIKIVYDQPWFWKVSAYKKEQKQEKKAEPKHKKATLELDEEEPAATQQPVEEQQKKNSEAAAKLLQEVAATTVEVKVEEKKPWELSPIAPGDDQLEPPKRKRGKIVTNPNP